MMVKVCGMMKPDNIKQVLSCGIDFIGFIFYPPSSRYIERIPKGIAFGNTKKTGVFVNENPDIVIEKYIDNKLHFVQLHGDESPQYCNELQKRQIKIIKAFSIDDDFDFDICKDYISGTDYFLFDTKGKLPGGNGKLFDWKKLEEYDLNKQFLLSGGIAPANIEEIKGFSHPQFAGIDLNSGFETEPGIKDYNKLKHFLDELQN